ncbi:hypothetical protein F4561_002339 [Lipingzhangella halophila]|uniref:DNA recombination-mediator protein A n=1 Tax=Lipingzhangella halophila TaxID=1783352 RepID=A0A7W7RGH0_9ACTN|nr:hypothetical protein [Lipingzhangella halophila]MBB4931519.1 hypothetical protein [Lipingzhangella halophila]
MRRIAITGHRELAANVEQAVEQGIRARLATFGRSLVGLSCLADGADTIFAKLVVDAGARLEVVVPAIRYREGLPESHHATYDELLRRAALVHRLPHVESTPDSHLEAGRHMVQRCDEIIAVWDGRPARGPGGTADVVSLAQRRGRPVTVIWPEGAQR